MDDLIIHSLQGRTVPREEEELRHWLEEDHENERFYRKLAALWDLVGVVEMLRVGGRPPEATEVIALGEEPRPSPLRKRNPPAIRDPEPQLRSVSRVPTWRRAFAFGAIAASVAAVGFGLGSV